MGVFANLMLTGDWFYLLFLLGGIVPCLWILTLFSQVRSRVLYRFGDPVPALNGGRAWNPIHHVHPVGFIFFVTTGIGWGKWTEIDRNNLKRPVRDHFLAFLAGWSSCIVVGCLCFWWAGILFHSATQSAWLVYFIWFLAYNGVLSISFGLFQWLPLPGFLCYLVLFPYLPQKVSRKLEGWAGQITLLYGVLLWTGLLLPRICQLMSFLVEPLCFLTGLPFSFVEYYFL